MGGTFANPQAINHRRVLAGHGVGGTFANPQAINHRRVLAGHGVGGTFANPQAINHRRVRGGHIRQQAPHISTALYPCGYLHPIYIQIGHGVAEAGHGAGGHLLGRGFRRRLGLALGLVLHTDTHDFGLAVASRL